ncbi:MAG: transposase [Cuspidothrix sp.]
MGHMEVSKQAVSKRLMNTPAEIFVQLLNQVVEKIAKTESKTVLEKKWEQLQKKFNTIWIADGSSLEQLRKRLKISEDNSSKLGGKIMMIVEAFTQNPVKLWYEPNPKSHDQNWGEDLLEKLPERGLIIVDLGFFSFNWFDKLTESKKYFITAVCDQVQYKSKVKNMVW